jgi:hypothetical protein
LTEAARNLLDGPRHSGVVPIVNKHDIGTFGHIAMASACLFGLACAAVGGAAGLLAAAWNVVTLIGSGRRVGPKIGITTFGLAAIYGLAALAGFGGDDPEDVDRHLSIRLAVVAVGCAVVGITSALVWIADRSRRDR